MAYHFSSGVNPKRPRDKRDPCPPGWETAIEDAHDRSKQFWGYSPSHLKAYIEWERREIQRLSDARRRHESQDSDYDDCCGQFRWNGTVDDGPNSGPVCDACPRRREII